MKGRQTIEAVPETDDERLWRAMLTVFPAIITDDLKHAPEGCAQLCREHAQALLTEWRRTQEPVTKWSPSDWVERD